MARYVPSTTPANDPEITDGFVADPPRPIKPVNTRNLDAGMRVGPPMPKIRIGVNKQGDQVL